MSTPPSRRERPRTVYASLHRSSTNIPFLSLKPVTFSLTDGTSIPPPLEEDIKQLNLQPSPTRSSFRVQPLRFRARKNQDASKYSPFPSPASYAPQTIFDNTVLPQSPSLVGGPLGSHPVATPTASPSVGNSPTSFSNISSMAEEPSSASSVSSPSFTEVSTPPSSAPDAEAYELEGDCGHISDCEDDDGLTRRQTWRTDRATIGGNRLSTMYEWQAQLAAISESPNPLNSSPSLRQKPQNRPHRLFSRFMRKSKTTDVNISPISISSPIFMPDSASPIQAEAVPEQKSKLKKSKVPKPERNPYAGLGLSAGPQAYTFEGDARLRDWDAPAVVNARSGLRGKRAVSLGAGMAFDSAGDVDEPLVMNKGGLKRRTTTMGGGENATNTFPRMVRKRSMDLLASAGRRVSGNWWHGNDDTEDAENKDAGKLGGDDDNNRVTVIWEPAPKLPDLVTMGADISGGKMLGFEDVLNEIGQDGSAKQGKGEGRRGSMG